MDQRALGHTGLRVTSIGFGAFKIGRNEGTKYGTAYALPSEEDASALLNSVLDLGINLIDTAPAYGQSEARIGNAIASRRDEFVLSTKAGEQFIDGTSVYNFTRSAIEASVAQSLRRLRTDVLDIVFVHSDGHDNRILLETDAVETLCELRDSGLIRAVGFSGKTVTGATAASALCDVLMIEYHPEDTSHDELLRECAHRGVGVIVKKGLASGRLKPEDAIPFVLRAPAVASMVVGTLNLKHIKDNMRIAASCEQ